MAIVKKDNSYNPFGVDAGNYELVVTEIEEKENTRFDKKPFLIWRFQVLEPIRNGEYLSDDEEITVTGSTPSIPVEGQKFDLWLRACGIFIEDGEEFDTDEVVGKHVTGWVEKIPDTKTGKEYAKVTKLAPVRAKPSAKPSTSTGAKPVARTGKPPVRKSAPVADDTEAEDLIEEVAAEEAAAKKVAAKPASKGKMKAAAAEELEDQGNGGEADPFGEFDENDDVPI